MNRLLLFIVFILSSSTFFAQTELITNGDFETGDFTDWSVTTIGLHSVNINDGTYSGGCFGNSQSPLNDNFDVIFDQGGPGSGLLSSGFIVPNSITSATFSFVYEYTNTATIFDFNAGNEQYFLVELLDASMVPVDTLFLTDVGDPAMAPETAYSENLLTTFSPFVGQMMYLRFDQTDNLGCFPVRIDNVSIDINVGNAVPTIGQWGSIILGLSIVIFGVAASKEKELIVDTQNSNF